MSVCRLIDLTRSVNVSIVIRLV